ncbi:CRISPR-associated protein Csy1 [Vibrio phage 1.161.O._10N.261.48.C5]|nr:CRISPR-associated protein Csy1 [Vibrio phage 1.161.O._10N.261.48.C5]
MLKKMLEHAVNLQGKIFTHGGKYTHTSNNMYVCNLQNGLKLDMYTPKSASLKCGEGHNLLHYLNENVESGKFLWEEIVSGDRGEELQQMFLQLVSNTHDQASDFKNLPQIYFTKDDSYITVVPLTNTGLVQKCTESLMEHRPYKAFTHKVGGSNPQNVSFVCNKMRGGFRTFNTCPPNVMENYNA